MGTMVQLRIAVTAALVGLFLIASACTASMGEMSPTPRSTSPTMGETGSPTPFRDFAPLVKGFAKGGEVLFIHTETSDPDVATMLTNMMGPKVIAVSSLAQVPASLLGNVYAFTNGVRGGGPFGFQADVFDSVPGDRGYTPLRALHLVTWKDGATPTELRSAEEIKSAEARGDVTAARRDVVVNMPVLAWPDGQR
ncbi:MAG: hypothetical protein HY683_00595 [Chloroflexi bacterium]|nr:hypothetical protein [Chloroflexota bacterium]